MYSVLIQNQKTIEYFQDFHPLFMEAFNKEKIGCCRWVESGVTVETALPGLCDLIADKEEWRAIVVRVEDEKNMSEFEASPYNPYDFIMDESYSSIVTESEIPLIRLSHMLGGIPMPEDEFIPDVKIMEYKAPMPYFKKDDSLEARQKRAENQKEYAELTQKYAFDGKKPVNILFITFHGAAVKNLRKVAEAAWNDQLEIHSSDFWKRNRYPGVCRFLMYEYVKEGHVQKEADMFNFWTCVMMMATNDIDPSTLQAYRLYTIRAEFDKKKMTRIFQNEVDSLKGCRNFIEAEIKREVERRMNEKNPMPIYRMNIPVAMEMPSYMEVNVDKKEFNICPRSINNDLRKWEGLQTGTEEALNVVYCRAERALAESASRMRYFCSVTEQEVVSLDFFQKQDMKQELSKTYNKILQTQSTLSGTRNKNFEKVRETARKVRNTLLLRIDKQLAIEIGILNLFLVILSCLPAFMFSVRYQVGSIGNIIVHMLFAAVFFGIAEFIVLRRYKKDLTKNIEEYNEAMEKNVEVLTADMEMFSNFVSNIVSYSRGKSYLKILKYKKFKTETQYENLQQHIRAIDNMMEKMNRWCTAFYLSVDFNRQHNDNFMVDADVKPKANALYTFESKKEYNVPLNETGDMLTSPFGFVEKLCIEREELFEDARSYE